jgi:ketosteroid isomerase-like protein
MANDDTTRIARAAFDAFLRKDIPGLLALLGDAVDWEPIVGAAAHVPMRGRRVGVQQVAEFFRILGEQTVFSRFEPREFIAQGERVAVLGYYEGTAQRTGRNWKAEWVMVMTVRNGKIVHFREYVDVSGINAAFAAD